MNIHLIYLSSIIGLGENDVSSYYVVTDGISFLWFSSILFFTGLLGLFLMSAKPINIIVSLEVMYIGILMNFMAAFEISCYQPNAIVFGYLVMLFAAIDSVLIITLYLLSFNAGSSHDES